jgi:hypothetical protein
MSWVSGLCGKTEKPDRLGAEAGLCGDEAQDLAMKEALMTFRMSVHAWSDVAYSRQRKVTQVVYRGIWRQAAGWTLGCALVVAGISGGLSQREQRLERARIAAEQQKQTVQLSPVSEEQVGQEEEDLLASVDSDVSRQVPSAMEPLARMMNDETK